MRPRTFWHVFSLTLTSPTYYRQLLQTPLWFSVRFFLMSMILLGLTVTLRFAVMTLPEWQKGAEAMGAEILTKYPSNLVISWDQSHLSLSPAETQTIPYPQAVGELELSELPSHFGFITPQELKPEEFESQLPGKSLFVATPTTLFVNDVSGTWSSFPLHEFPGFENSFSISKATLPDQVRAGLAQVQEVLPIIGAMSILFWPPYLIITSLWMAAIEGLIAFFILRVINFPLPYAKIFQILLHVLVVAEVVNQIALWIYGSLQIPLFSIAFWLVFAVVILQLRADSSSRKSVE